MRLALVKTVSDGVAPVLAPPSGLRLAATPRLAFELPAGMLAVSCSWVRPEPPAADRARSLPGRGHGSSIFSMATPAVSSFGLGHFWKARVGQFSRAPKWMWYPYPVLPFRRSHDWVRRPTERYGDCGQDVINSLIVTAICFEIELLSQLGAHRFLESRGRCLSLNCIRTNKQIGLINPSR